MKKGTVTREAVSEVRETNKQSGAGKIVRHTGETVKGTGETGERPSRERGR